MKKIFKKKLSLISKSINKFLLNLLNLKIFLFSLFFVLNLKIYSSDCIAYVPTFSLTNIFRSGNGKEDILGSSIKKNYLEEEVNIQTIWRNFLFCARYEYDKHAEFGFDHNELRKKYIEYRNGPWGLRLGTLNTLFAKGMVLNIYEDKFIGHDSEISGILANYGTEKFTFKLVKGSCNYEVIPDFKDIIRYTLNGGLLQYKIFETLVVGSSYLKSEISQKVGFYKKKDFFNMNNSEIFLDLRHGNIGFFTNIASNKEKFHDLFIKGNNSIYLEFDYILSKMGINIEYKKYNFGLASPSDQNFTLRHNRFLPFQNPPTVLKEQNWTLLSRSSHVVNFNDELGLQLDVLYSINPQTTLNFNGGMASRNYSYFFNPSYGTFSREEKYTIWLPTFKKPFSPFWNLYMEYEHFFYSGSSTIIGISYISDFTYNNYFSNMSEKTESFVLPFYLNYLITDKYSLSLTSEIKRFKDTKYKGKILYNHIYSLGLAQSPSLSFAITSEFFSKGVDFSEKTKWISFSTQYRFRSKHLFEVSYGEELGGLKCTNGLCRYVPPFYGWRCMVTNQF